MPVVLTERAPRSLALRLTSLLPRRRSAIGAVAAIHLLLIAAIVTVPGLRGRSSAATVPSTVTVYNGSLASGFEDWGWTTRTLGTTAKAAPATVDLGGWNGWIIAHPSGPIGLYQQLRFRIKVPAAGVTNVVNLRLENAKGEGTSTPLDFAPFAADATGFRSVTFPMTALNPSAGFDRLMFVGQGGVSGRLAVQLDAISFTGTPTSTERFGLPLSPTATLAKNATIDCASANQPINPNIYGIAYDGMKGNDPASYTFGATTRRLGGNNSSRLNYDLGNAWNLDMDWYFENIAMGASWQQILEDSRSHGLGTALTIPTIGWVAKDTTSNGFPVSVFGPQSSADPWRPDAGSGYSTSGTPLTPRSPEQTSVAAPPSSAARWARLIAEQVAWSGARVDSIVLDNEPDLWHETHRDIRTTGIGMDELFQRTVDYSAAVKSVLPNVKVAGLASWGVMGYLWSAKDSTTPGWPGVHPDRDAHGGMPLIPWYLQALKNYDATRGTRSIDLLDVHYYPMATGVYSSAMSPSTAALRVRSTRSLWDPTYVDESWLTATEIPAITLLPRLQNWITTYYPGTGLQIGEWSFGGEQHISGALATAETLGQFGRNGVASAYYWTYPGTDSATAMAFRAFRDYDGTGRSFGPIGVGVAGDTTTNDDRLSVFASKDPATGRTIAVVLNLSQDKQMDTALSVANCAGATAFRTYTYDGSNGPQFAKSTDTPVANGTARLSLAPSSITVVEFGSFAALPPCAAPTTTTSTTTSSTTTSSTAAPSTTTSTTTTTVAPSTTSTEATTTSSSVAPTTTTTAETTTPSTVPAATSTSTSTSTVDPTTTTILPTTTAAVLVTPLTETSTTVPPETTTTAAAATTTTPDTTTTTAPETTTTVPETTTTTTLPPTTTTLPPPTTTTPCTPPTTVLVGRAPVTTLVPPPSTTTTSTTTTTTTTTSTTTTTTVAPTTTTTVAPTSTTTATTSSTTPPTTTSSVASTTTTIVAASTTTPPTTTTTTVPPTTTTTTAVTATTTTLPPTTTTTTTRPPTTTTIARPAPVAVYVDAFVRPWTATATGAKLTIGDRTQVRGSRSLLIAPTTSAATLKVTSSTAVALSPQAEFSFWVYGGGTATTPTKLRVGTANGSSATATVSLTAPAGTWTQFTVTAAQLGGPTALTDIVIRTDGTTTQPRFWVDDVTLRP